MRGVKLVTSFVSRLHTLVVGPGLGRSVHVAEMTTAVLNFARDHNISLVIDADGLWLLTQNILLLHGCSK
jgi:ATP-dependent NAD(P)H-hydrate dehydratase